MSFMHGVKFFEVSLHSSWSLTNTLQADKYGLLEAIRGALDEEGGEEQDDASFRLRQASLGPDQPSEHRHVAEQHHGVG
jgi:hypothetical protein